MRRPVLQIVIVAAAFQASGLSWGADAPLQVAPFRADITPSVGVSPCIGYIFPEKIERVGTPLESRGIVLRFGGKTCVLCSLDLPQLGTVSDLALRRSLAKAVGSEPEWVTAHSLHLHTAPTLDADAARLLFGEDSDRFRSHEAYQAKVIAATSEAAKAALEKLSPVTSIVASRAIVDRVASNRRVRQPDGSVVVRYSFVKDRALWDAPEGLIDPWVRTLTFLNGNRPLAQLHYYATHPQTFTGEPVSWDIIGMARSAVEKDTGVPQAYFNGCGGNLTVGKYNDGTEQGRAILAERLFDGMRRSAQLGLNPAEKTDDRSRREVTVQLSAGTPIAWDVESIAFPERSDGEFAYEHNQAIVADKQGPLGTRLMAATYLPWADRVRAGYRPPVPRLKIGDIQIVHLPGEPFVEFQLFAQRAAPESFVCVAGYGEACVWYYGPDSIYSDRGGYEQTYSFTTTGCQKRVETALTNVLKEK